MKVDIYIETSSIYQGITDRKCSYVLSVSIRNEERTKEGFGHLEGTWHQAVLVTLAEALERMTVGMRLQNTRRNDKCRLLQTWKRLL